MDSIDPVHNLVDVAIIVNPRDNVATVRVPLGRGTSLATEDQPLLIRDDIAFGHKFALTGICSGASVIKFGDPIVWGS